MSKLFKYFLPLRDFLYILQLEEYELLRYLRQIGPRLWKRDFENRDKLVLTFRIKLTIIFWSTLYALLLSGGWFLHLGVFIGLLLSTPLITPYLIGLASFTISGLRQPIIWHQLHRTRHLLRTNYPQLRIIAITGSYGKTTTKYLLYEMLRYSYEVAIIPDNINTLLGITKHLQTHPLSPRTEYLIVEVGAYYPGDIKAVVELLHPSIRIITALGDQHWERFGSQEKLVQAKAELFTTTPGNDTCYITDAANQVLAEYSLTDPRYTVVPTSEYTSSNHAVAQAVARSLNVPSSFITEAVARYTPPARRNDMYTTNNVTIIDNSYNISYDTAAHTIPAAAKQAAAAGKQLVIYTAGIPEQGSKSEATNKNFATLINQHAVRVIFSDSVYRPMIAPHLTVPQTINNELATILLSPEKHVDASTEILLVFPELTDLSYVD